MSLRIVHIVGKMMAGGVEATVLNHYRNIDKSVIQFDFIVHDDSTVVPETELSTLGARVYRIPSYQNPIRYARAMYSIFKTHNYRIVHSHMNALSVLPLAIAWICRIPVRIAHNHTLSSRRERIRHLIKMMLRPFSKVFATQYAACSMDAAKWLFGRHAVSRQHVKILHNAMDLDVFEFDADSREQLREDLSISPQTLVLGCVGRLVRTKNYDFSFAVLRALQDVIPDSKLLIIGDGEERSRLIELSDRLGIRESVLFLGARQDVAKFYQAMDAFLFPSLYEGLGMSLVEAQISGLPSYTTTNVPSEATIAPPLVTVFPPDASANEWATRIATSDRLVRKGSANLAAARGYDIRQSADALTDWYLQLERGAK